MSLMTAELRVHIKRHIDVLSREALEDERVLFCPTCFEPYDRGTSNKLCGCNRIRKARYRIRKAASPVAA